MSSAVEFLDLYRQVEELLEAKYGYESSSNSNVIMQFIQSRQGARYKEQLNLCREVRNVLSHHANVGGEPVVEPAAGLLASLRDLIGELSAPPLAMDFATPAEKIVMTTPKRKVLPLMVTMQEKGFSHIPIWYFGEMVGVFSTSTVFAFTVANPGKTLDEDTLVQEFAEFYPLAAHTERYLFATPDMSYWEAKEAFTKVTKHKRLAAIFLTDTGKATGKLLGMLTPWDVLGLDEVG